MSSKILLLLVTAVSVRGSFMQTSNQFQSTFNSTFLTDNEKLFKPIIIPNITRSTEQPPTLKVYEMTKPKGNETATRKIFNSKEISQEVSAKRNYLDEEPKTTGNSVKFSSRYSTKLEAHNEPNQGQSEEETPREVESQIKSTTTEISKSEKTGGVTTTTGFFSDRSDDLGDSEEEKDDTSEPREAEQSEIAPTTNEPYSELQRPTSFQSTSYSDDDLDNYETTSTSAEETDSSEEKKEEEAEEDKRSVKDYYNSGSKNYHSIQTPLSQVKYRGAHSYPGGFESEKIRTRLVSPMNRHHDKPSWPYSRPKGNIEKLNEISDIDVSYEEEEKLEKVLRTKPKPLDLELAVEKDEFKFDRNRKYNQVEERNRRNQQKKELVAEEEKDEKVPLFQRLNQYQVDEKPRYKSTSRESVISKFKAKEDSRPSKPLSTTPKYLRGTTRRKPQKFGAANELTHNYHGKHFLGPVVFNHNFEELKPTPAGKHITTQKVPVRSSYLKKLLENEKLDQDNLTNQRSEKLILTTGNQHNKSFNHLEESEEMYNAILANIQSVFGIRTQSLKSTSQKGSNPEVNLEESKSLTWSLPLINRTKLL